MRSDRNHAARRLFGNIKVTVVLVIFLAVSTGLSKLAAAEQHGGKGYTLPMSAPRLLGLTLLSSTFHDAESVFGPARTFQNSGAVEAPLLACYQENRDGRKTHLIFRSNYTGGWKYLSGFTLTEKPFKSEENCFPTTRKLRALRVLRGRLSLGMTKGEVIKSIGKPRIHNLGNWDRASLPKTRTPQHWIYLSTWKKRIKRNPSSGAGHSKGYELDAWVDIELKFKASKVAAISVTYGESY